MNRSEESIKLKDVARAAGVSVSSASRAISTPSAVSDSLRTRILAAVQRLGYPPTLAARAWAPQRSGLVGFLVRSPTDPLAAALLVSLDEPLRRAGYRIVLALCPDGHP